MTPSDHPDAKRQLEGEGDWIEWSGGECPVAGDVKVDVLFRSDIGGTGFLAGFWDHEPSLWQHRGPDHSRDIIAYRVVPK